MDSKTFFDNFETIANAPGGIARLRELILALAINGSFSTESEKWTQETFDSIGKWIGGNGFPTEEQGKSGSEILFCKVSDMNLEGNEKFIHQTVNTLTKDDANRLKVTIHERGSVIFPKIGGAIATNKRRILVRPTAIDNNCMGVQPSNRVNNEWLYLLLKSIDLTKYQSGTSLPSLSQKVLNKITFKVPPLEEQQQIVLKVNKLIELCDELEASQNHRNSIRTAARKSTIDAISTASSPEELDVAWKRISGNWLTIADTPGSIASLRSLIHDVALSGAFGGADTWRDLPLGDISKISYGYTESAKQQEVGPKFLRITDIQNGIVDWDRVPFCVISKEDEKKQKLESGDIVFARTGATTGKSHLLIDPPRSVCASYLIRLRPEREEILPEYLYLYFQSGRYWLSVRTGMSGTAQGGFNSTKLGSMSVLVPALDEQKRIIAKVHELIELCDELESSLIERNELTKKIAGSLANAAAA